MLKGGIFTLLTLVIAHVRGQGCSDGDVRLVGGSTSLEGTVEVCSSGLWYQICDNGWSQNDAKVTCTSLGYSGLEVHAYGSSVFGGTGQPIQFSDFECQGDEANLAECVSSTSVPSTCSINTVAGVSCVTKGTCENAGFTSCCTGGCNIGGCYCDSACYSFGDCCYDDIGLTCPAPECSENDVRLVDGFTPQDGRVEVCVGGKWSGICDSQWDINDAMVICTQAGYPITNPVVYTGSYPYGQGSEGLSVGGFQCAGSESAWNLCTYSSNASCGHHEEAAVDCNGPCTTNAVRLVNGTSSSGRVQYCANQQWGSIGGDGWSQNDAKVVCVQTGNSQYEYHSYSAVEQFGYAQYNQVLTSVTCNGNELNLGGCSSTPSSSAPGGSVASVECLTQPLCEAAGITSCCITGPCNPFGGACWCDSSCYLFGDCCDGIEYTCVLSPTVECTNGDLRLDNGTSMYNGRVDVCVDQKWGSICDSNWDDSDAMVVCNQLSFSTSGASAVTGSYFPVATSDIVANNFGCTGAESQLTNCAYTQSGDCNHQEEAGVFCPEACTVEGDVRLVNGSNVYVGRVEVCVGGYWGTICQGFWSLEDATVICRQLGYSEIGVKAYGNAYYGEGQTLIHWTDLQCNGAELELSSCPKSTSPSCTHSMDVAVECAVKGPCEQAGFTSCCDSASCNVDGCWCDAACYSFGDCCFEDIYVTCPQGAFTDCTVGTVRLVGTNSDSMGTVEYCVNGFWTTICDNGWSTEDAQVVCAQLGQPSAAATAVLGAAFGQGSGTVSTENYACTGTEMSLSECTMSTTSQCSHIQDAGVICSAGCTNEGEVRLLGGPTTNTGHIEVCKNSIWVTVCDLNWCEADARVVCRELGYSENRAEPYGGSYFGQTVVQPGYTNVGCVGTEASFADCSKMDTTGGTSTCSFATTAGVKCYEPSSCETALGLTSCCTSACNVGSCYCDLACHTFNDCCPGIENTCPFPCTDGDSRIVNGTDIFEGRVEVCVDGSWGAVCDSSWDSTDAAIVCAQNNLPSSDVVAYFDSSFGAGDVTIRATNFQCSGGEASLIDCAYTPVDSTNCCNHNDEAGVRCTPECVDGDVRLVDGGTEYEGRVEVCFNGQFATVCDNSWSKKDASVLCGSLGYSYISAQAYGGAFFGPGTGTLVGYGSVVCNGTESSLLNCSYIQLPGDCGHDQDASVVCTPLGNCELYGHTGCCDTNCNAGGCFCDAICHDFLDCCSDIQYTCPLTTCTPGEIRLDDSGLGYPYAGRVELCIDGVWGTVCSDFWDDIDAGVVCQQLGYTLYESYAANSSFFGPGVGLDIVASNFACDGSESSIYNCTYSADPDCGHQQDAAVLCNVPCDEGDVRLVNGTTEYVGRVEICYNASWYAICDNGWSTEDAIVTCSRAGYSVLNAQAYGNSLYGAGLVTPILNNVNCTGTENNLLECQFVSGDLATCGLDSYAGVDCQGDILSGGCEEDGHTTCCSSGCFAGTCWCDAACHGFGDCCADIDLTCPQDVCNTGDIRVIGGDSAYNGRAEICIDGQFGTICDEGWDNNDAVVFCTQLTGGGGTGSMAVTGAGFGQAEDLDIFINNVGCIGTENSISDCPSDSNPSCGHHQDAGVLCPEPCFLFGDLRLVNGSSSSQGRIEVCINGVWSSVCADESVCDELGKFACAYLGFSPLRADVFGLAIYGESPGPVGLEAISCPPETTSLADCTYTSPSTCSHSMDAGINCYPNTPCALAGHTGCCTSGCFVGGCWCDAICHIFNDCCEDIEVTCPSSGGNPSSGTNDGCSGTDTRFLYGNDSSGVAQVCVDGKFTSVCSMGFGPEEAAIFCRGLGYADTGFTILPTTVYGQALGNVYEKNLQCEGDELALTDCEGDDVCCGHQFDTGLICKPACVDGDIRLVGGTTEMEGRVEICDKGRWGTVCDDSWDFKDARVACKQANLPWKGAVAWSSSTFGNGIGPILLDDVDCDGSEGTLFNCSANTNHNCGHHEDAGVTCAPGPCELAGFTETCCDPSTGKDCQGKNSQDVCYCSYDCHDHSDCCSDADFICSCTEGDLRLVDGGNEMEGRVEICLNSQWGTVCDDFWGAADAKVVCNQLGLPSAGAEAFNFAYFGQGTGPIQLDNVQCEGTEDFLLNCSHLQQHNCAHFEDASVRCSPEECVHGGIRLTGGSTSSAGQLDVCVGGVWGTVCDDLWDQMNSEVACKQLGLPSEGALEVNSWQYFGFGSGPINMDNVNCIGNETSLFDCDYITNHNCGHFEDVGLICLESCTTEGKVRLTGGNFDNEGRVEICKNQQWTTICDDNWDSLDAAVACKSAGFPPEGARALVNLQFGIGWGEISYTDFACTGLENNLTECSSSSSTQFCSHFDDAGVQCPGACSDGDARLVDGNANNTAGRVEICRNSTWGTICDNTNSWSTADAMVVCRQLLLPFSAAQSEDFGPGADPIHYSNVGCNGQEQSLVSCDKDLTPTTCSHFDDVGVTCLDACPSGDVTLVDGNEPWNGRVEVCIGGKWGTVCDHEWDHQDCQTICKQLGYPYEGAEAKFGAYFGQGDAHIAISQVHCDDTDTQISDCLFSSGTDVTCSHANDASCICQDLCTNGDIRLSDGNGPNEGRVEICFNGEWGTVCDNNWSTDDGRVVCRQLGFPTDNIRVFGSSKFGSGIGPIYYTNVQCAGTESALYFCPVNTDTDSCEHYEDVGLRCPDLPDTPPSTSAPPVTQTPPPCPDAVTNLNCTITDTQTVIQWDEPANPNGIITSYAVNYARDDFQDTTLLGNEPRQLLLPIQDPGVPITVTIRPSNLFCAGPPAKITCYSEQLPPLAVTDVTGSRRDEYTMVVSWAPLTDEQARGYISSYFMQYGPYDGTYSQVLQTKMVYIEQVPMDVPGLDLTSSYYVRVLGTNAAGNGTYSTPIVVSTTSTGLFQLKLALIEGQTCANYVLDNTNDKVADIIGQVAKEVNTRCRGCSFSTDHISDAVFQCNPNEEDQVTFRARLYAVGTLPSSTFTQYITDWITNQSSTPVLIVQSLSLNVDPDCVVDITSFDDPFCGTRSPLALTTAGTVGIIIVVVIVVMVVLLIVVIVIVRRTRTKYQANNYTDHEMVGYSNRMAFPEEGDGDNISQKMGSTVHDDDFQEAINIISTDIEQMHGDDDKARLAAEYGDK